MDMGIDNLSDSERSAARVSFGRRTGMGEDRSNIVEPPYNVVIHDPYTAVYPLDYEIVVVDRNFAQVVREARLASRDPMTGRAYTMARLAEFLHVSKSLVSAWESGRSEGISVDALNGLAEYLPVSVEELLRSLGYNLKRTPLSPSEIRLLQIRQKLSPADQGALERAALGLLGLPQDPRERARAEAGQPGRPADQE